VDVTIRLTPRIYTVGGPRVFTIRLRSGAVGSGAALVADGDRGDITVSGGGSVWTLDAPVATARLGTGTADASTFLRGDQTYQHIEAVRFAVKNTSGGALSAGTPVYATGSVGASGATEVAAADAGNAAKMPAIGLLEATLAQNGQGFATSLGIVRSLDTSAYPINGVVFVAVGGGLTGTRPTGTTELVQNIGRVVRVQASTGEILVMGPGRTNDVQNLVPAVRLGTGTADATTYLRGDSTWATVSAGGVTDGDKGDVTVSGSGATWTVDAVGGVTASNVASHVASTSNPHATTAAQVGADPAGTAASAVSTHAALTSGVHGISAFGASLVDDVDASAARTTLGLAAIASSGSASDLTSGTVGTARLASGTASASTYLRGDQTWSGITASDVGAQASDADLTAIAALSGTGIARRTGANTWSVGTLVTGAELATNTVALSNLATISTARILGRVTAATGNVESLTGTQATTLLDAFTSTLKGLAPASGGGTTNFLRADGSWAAPSSGGVTDGDKGDITVSSSGTVWTIDAGVVTYAKIQNVSATDRLLGRSTAGAGSVEEIACTAAGRAILDDVDAAAQRTTLGLATIASSASASDLTSGTVGTARLASGTADATTFLRGDQTWAVPPGGGGSGITTSQAVSAAWLTGV
jgi:hypothetical protein